VWGDHQEQPVVQEVVQQVSATVVQHFVILLSQSEWLLGEHIGEQFFHEITSKLQALFLKLFDWRKVTIDAEHRVMRHLPETVDPVAVQVTEAAAIICLPHH